VVFKIPRPPCIPAHGRLGIQFGGLKIFLGQIFFQAQIPVPIVLELGTDIDLVVSRICVDVISFLTSPNHRQFIRRERLKMMLLLGRRSDDGPEACRREQVLCLPRLSAAQSGDDPAMRGRFRDPKRKACRTCPWLDYQRSTRGGSQDVIGSSTQPPTIVDQYDRSSPGILAAVNFPGVRITE